MTVQTISFQRRPSGEKTGFREGLRLALEAGYEFPLLARALADMETATDTQITWADGKGRNYTQIIRTLYGFSRPACAVKFYGDVLAKEKLKRMVLHLCDVEAVLEHGKAERRIELHWEQNEDGEWEIVERMYQSCGGYRWFLHRDLIDTDTIRLHVLRDLTFISRFEEGGDGERSEFSSELSLEIVPG